jgi:hypothetical protein
VHIIAQDGVPTGVTQRMQSPFHDCGRHCGILFQPFGDGAFERIELALAVAWGGRLCRRIEILLAGPPAHAQKTLDLTDRLALRPVQAMQVVDLIGGKHGRLLLSGRNYLISRTLLFARFRSRRLARRTGSDHRPSAQHRNRDRIIPVPADGRREEETLKWRAPGRAVIATPASVPPKRRHPTGVAMLHYRRGGKKQTLAEWGI